MQAARLIIPCVLAIACFPELELNPTGRDSLGPDSTEGEEGGEGVESIELELSAADPFHGSNSGGLLTQLEGGPFDQSVEIWFDGVQAEVLAVAESTIEVVVPAYDSTGPVSITATTDDGSGEVALGFRYWEDQAGNTVITGALLQWDWVGPDVLDSEGQVVFEGRYAFGEIMQLEPGDWTFMDALAPSVGECGPGTLPSTASVPMPNEMSVQSSGISLEFEPWPDLDHLYYYNEEQDPDLADRSYSMEIPSGGEYPDQVIEDAIVMSSAGIRMTSPTIDQYGYLGVLDYVNMASDPIRWEGASGDYIYLDFYDGWGSEKSFGCVVENTGSFDLSQVDFDGFISTEYGAIVDWYYINGPLYQAYFRVIDLNIAEQPLDFNNGNSSMLGGTGVMGVAYFWDAD